MKAALMLSVIMVAIALFCVLPSSTDAGLLSGVAKVLKAKDSLIKVAREHTGTKGSLEAGGSTISWEVTGQLMGFKWKYVCIAKDSATGKTAQAITNSQTGAVEHALEKLFAQLEGK